MSQWNTLSVPLETGWQCTLVLASHYRSPSGEWLALMRRGERKQLEQDRTDFDRYFRPRRDLRTVTGETELDTIQSFLSDILNVVHWDLPRDNSGIERVLRKAVADGRLVPVINREWRSRPQVSRPVPAPERWHSGGGGSADGGQTWAAFSGVGSGPPSFSGEPILSGPYDPTMQEAKLIAARGAMAARGVGGGLPGVVGAVAGAAFGGDFDADETADDSGNTFTPVGNAQPFEYTPDPVSGDVEELAASTNNPKFAAKMLGYDQKTFGDMLHSFKPDNGLGPADNVIWHDNGDVYFNGNFVANFHDWAN